MDRFAFFMDQLHLFICKNMFFPKSVKVEYKFEPFLGHLVWNIDNMRRKVLSITVGVPLNLRQTG